MVPIYWGLFINSEDLIISGKLNRIISNPHVTFGFKTEYPMDIHGKSVKITIIGYGNDGQNEALLVKLPEEAMDIYNGAEVPHVTLSVSDNGKPVDSWKLDFDRISEIEIEGVYGYFDTKGTHID